MAPLRLVWWRWGGWPQVVDAGRAATGVLGSPAVSLSRVLLVSMCRRGAIYDARCRPQAARCQPHGQSRMLGGPPRACGHPPVVSPCRVTGVINGAPTFGVVAMGWLAAGGGCWVSRRGVFCWRACLSCRGVRSCCRGVRRIGCCGGMDKWTVGGGVDGGVWTGQ